jgi:hypothetical protein
MTTITSSALRAPARSSENSAGDLLRALLQRIGSALRMPAPGVPEATAQLLRMAAAYESTQPSYAADLRAAASMAERETS